MEKETYEMLQMILSGIEGMEQRIDARFVALEKRIDKVETEVKGVKILIENDVGKRIDALFDGYHLAHEKQWEPGRMVEKLAARVERLEAQAG